MYGQTGSCPNQISCGCFLGPFLASGRHCLLLLLELSGPSIYCFFALRNPKNIISLKLYNLFLLSYFFLSFYSLWNDWGD